MYRIVKKELVDTISIPMMALGKKLILTHKVKLSKPDLKGEREYFHKEFTYRSKYSDPERVTTLRLTHSSILVIENKNVDSHESLIINMTNRDFIVKSLSKCKKILKDPDLFIENKDGEFIVNPKLRDKTVISFKPYKGKVVIVRPCVVLDDDEPTGGLAMSLDSRNLSFIEISNASFRAFLKIVKKFDFHIAGLTAISYLQSSEIGNHQIDITRTNITDFDTDLEPQYNIKDKEDSIRLETLRTKPNKNKGW